MVAGIIYFIGVIINIIIGALLWYYFEKIEKEEIEDIGSFAIICIGSWLVTIMLLICYRGYWKTIFSSIFRKRGS